MNPQPTQIHTGNFPSRGLSNRDSGPGCAMEELARETGDSDVTDFPSCVDPFLARLVQLANDGHCTHLPARTLVCEPCSAELMSLARRTIGTAGTATRVDWATIVLNWPVSQPPLKHSMPMLDTIKGWIADPSPAQVEWVDRALRHWECWESLGVVPLVRWESRLARVVACPAPDDRLAAVGLGSALKRKLGGVAARDVSLLLDRWGDFNGS